MQGVAGEDVEKEEGGTGCKVSGVAAFAQKSWDWKCSQQQQSLVQFLLGLS